MKKLFIILVVVLVFNRLSTLSVYALSPLNSFASSTQMVNVAKGADNPQELAKMVLLAIQNNNFEDLNAILLDDASLSLLKKKGSEDMKALLENSSAGQIKESLRTNYQEIMQQGIARTINWTAVEVAEAKLGKGTPKNPMVQPVTVTLLNKENRPVQLLLETARLNNRYYLFQRMELKP